MDRDGTQAGYDIDLMNQRFLQQVNIPVIASGGVGNLDHLVDGIKLGKCKCCFSSIYISLRKIFCKRSQSNIWTQKEYLLGFNMLKTLESLFNKYALEIEKIHLQMRALIQTKLLER